MSDCSVKPAISARPKTISVNGVEVSRAAIARETQNHPAAKPIDAWQAAARALAIRELLLQEARRLAVPAEPLADADGRRETDEEAMIRGLIEREVRTPEPDEATCRRYYEANRARFRSPDLCEAAHILVPIAGGGERADARRAAEALILRLAEDPASFAALAKAHSACPSRDMGGNLGQIGPGQTVPEFEAALSAMTPGAVHREPVESRFGFHVVRLDRRIEGRTLPFELARPLIEDYLQERVRRTAERQYVQILAGKADIAGVALEGVASPLLQ
ncbi:MAG: peptidylprolyl isomerase [Beijerinckiaceae bacterium]